MNVHIFFFSSYRIVVSMALELPSISIKIPKIFNLLFIFDDEKKLNNVTHIENHITQFHCDEEFSLLHQKYNGVDDDTA